jgi:hypothetical protein
MTDKHPHVQELELLADWMDSKFFIPGTNYRFGLDPLIGLIPGIGDTAGLLISAYIFHKASAHDLPRHLKIRMIANIFIDWLIGLIPFLGDLFDIGWKANRRNVELLRLHLEKKAQAFHDDDVIDVEKL